MKSMPSCIAIWPVNGSMRQPKPDAFQRAAFTGSAVGISFFFTRASNSCDSSTPSRSVRVSIWRARKSSCRPKSPSERSCGGSARRQRPARARDLAEAEVLGRMPAADDSRSPRASRRMSCACISPSLTAMAFRFCRRNVARSRLPRSCCAARTSDCSSGQLEVGRVTHAEVARSGTASTTTPAAVRGSAERPGAGSRIRASWPWPTGRRSQ